MEREVEIEIRTLTGESTKVRISSKKMVNDLKLLLIHASSSPNFHLFFKGVKLSLKTQIDTLSIENGEFLALVPFNKKKDSPRTRTPDFYKNAPTEPSISTLADSTFSEMMQDLSFLSEKPTTSTSTHSTAAPQSDYMFSGYKRKRGFKDTPTSSSSDEELFCFLWSVLRSPNKNNYIVDDKTKCEKFVEVLDSFSCLTNPHSRTCVFLDLGLCGDKRSSCLCPAWLKRIMQAFAFLNIFTAFLQMQRQEITSDSLKEALKNLAKSGLKAGFEDIELLSVLCPKVIFFATNDSKFANAADVFVIINSETKDKDEIGEPSRKGKKSLSLSTIFDKMKKQESAFKTNLWEAAKFLLCKIENRVAMPFSLEDLLKFVRKDGISVSESEAKQAKGCHSSASSSYSFQSRCHISSELKTLTYQETNQLLPVEMVEHLREGIGSKGQIVHVEDIDSRKPIYVQVPNVLSDNMKSALKCMGITKLYSHQAESILASLSGKNVVVATMTSSGKSLCYNVPVLEALSQDLSACALYLFPTKALAQDQLRALAKMSKGFDTSINIGIYDGDTALKDRLLLRANARLLITNPDMLHLSILPYHRQFDRILSNLSDPSFVFSTATSANPCEHCMELANLSTLELIKNDGSPSSRKLFVLWNPTSCPRIVPNKSEGPMDVSESTEKSMSPISEVSCLFAEMVQHGLRCIAFCRSRKLTEIVLSYTREILQKTAPHLVSSICAYRAGYVAEDRRQIERDFFSGKLSGIAATNALELGIDVGHIDATLHLGFPGSFASLWQQAGRSGRRERPSLAVYVAFQGPLDQYFMKFPKKLFHGPVECCHIDAENQQVLKQHLVCAALEHPLSLLHDEKYFGSSLSNALMSLKNKGDLSFDPSRDSFARIWSYIGHGKMPSRGISIRAIESTRYRVIDMQRNEVLEEIEESKAFFQIYEGAVYMHQGKTYMVKELDISEKIALCYEADLHYYTKTRDYTDIDVLGGDIAYAPRAFKNQSSRTAAQALSCKVTTTWFGFYCIQRGSNKVLDTFDLSLPKYSYESQAVWIPVPQPIKKLVEEKQFSFRGGLHAASHALLNVVPLYIRCNSSDLAPECPNPHDSRYFPERILVYDQHPGGTGVSMQIQPYFTELLNAALELLTYCHCSGDTGCPNCVQSMVCHEYNEVIHKDAAIMIIKGVLDAESFFGEVNDSS
ncbi:PREDICTED: putative ATP-dependent helicase hrq1 isoform X3 [Populus euphratica]|uniref:ATP-dependent helicase hrq1 isoform X3 n=1 Tax=Populus euphratica TaxID=75702 RepID=A0AAJ6TNQ2_POPEU|nr:PREDICTED: putative ATP-dependent helicase hrq1 isoform X3 [Populus euphratica]